MRDGAAGSGFHNLCALQLAATLRPFFRTWVTSIWAERQ